MQSTALSMVERNQRKLINEKKREPMPVWMYFYTLSRPLSFILLPRRFCNSAVSQKRNSIEMDEFLVRCRNIKKRKNWTKNLETKIIKCNTHILYIKMNRIDYICYIVCTQNTFPTHLPASYTCNKNKHVWSKLTHTHSAHQVGFVVCRFWNMHEPYQ